MGDWEWMSARIYSKKPLFFHILERSPRARFFPPYHKISTFYKVLNIKYCLIGTVGEGHRTNYAQTGGFFFEKFHRPALLLAYVDHARGLRGYAQNSPHAPHLIVSNVFSSCMHRISLRNSMVKIWSMNFSDFSVQNDFIACSCFIQAPWTEGLFGLGGNGCDYRSVVKMWICL